MDIKTCDFAVMGTIIAKALAEGKSERELIAIKLLIRQILDTLSTIAVQNAFKIDKKL